jgi:hypothetical protein
MTFFAKNVCDKKLHFILSSSLSKSNISWAHKLQDLSSKSSALKLIKFPPSKMKYDKLFKMPFYKINTCYIIIIKNYWQKTGLVSTSKTFE